MSGANQCQPTRQSRDGQPAPKYYGKYRGKVLDNIDPLFQGRVKVEVAAVPGSKLNWALPCTPYGGPGVGFYAIPPIGANIWVEFEGGDPNFPIWVGCFWTEGQVPEGPDGPPPPETKIFKTEFITMVLNDVPEAGGFILECKPEAVATPLKMVFNSTGIEINAAPAIIKMVTEEGITLEFPPSSIEMTEEAIAIESNDISATATPGAVAVTADADIAMSALGAVEISGSGDVSMEAGGAVEIFGGGDASMEAGGAIEVTSGLDVAITAGLAAELTAGADVAITAGLAAELTAGADAAITAVGVTEVTSVGIAMTGAVEVSGDLLIDGQQPVVI